MCFFFFYFSQNFIYLPFIPVWAFHSFQKWDQNDTIRRKCYYFTQNFKPGRIKDVNLQRYAVNSKYQEYWQRIHKNSYSFYTKFVNFFPYNVLYKKVEIFELKNHENCHFMKKNQNFEIFRLEYLLNTCKYHAKIFFLLFFCDFEHIKIGFRRFKILVLTVDIKSPIY